jgi:hypothetical protein
MCRLTPPSRGLACGQPLTSNVRPPQSGNSQVGMSASVGSSVHQGESPLLVAVARMCCRVSVSASPSSPRSCRRRQASVRVVLGVAECSTFCGPASSQPGNSHAFRHRQRVMLCLVAAWPVGSSSPARSRMRKSPVISASRRFMSSEALPAGPAVRALLAAVNRPWPNPSVKGTSTSGLRPLAAAPYVER